MAAPPTPPPSPKMAPPKKHAVASGRVAKSPRKEKMKVFAMGPSTSASSDTLPRDVKDQPFRFLALPGELRNQIYHYCIAQSQQALVHHLPRRAALRPRKPHADPERRSHRYYAGLTQVCQQIRSEFRPIYLLTQEIGLDFTQMSKYIADFYPEGTAPDSRVGNITIALSGRVSAMEKDPKGVDVYPMLDIWANSYRMEAGFGRYYSAIYNAYQDGEAKDLYRLFGRKVLPDRRCTNMNRQWRDVLKGHQLAEIRVHRRPSKGAWPFFHIIYKPEFKEHWMKGEVSNMIDSMTDLHGKRCDAWTERMGFQRMEHFQIKVGVQNGGDCVKLWRTVAPIVITID